MYCVKVGHSFLWCPFVLHVVHQTTSLLSLPHSSSVEMLNYSDPPSTPLLLDISFDIGSLPVVRLPVEPLPKFETSIVSKGISSVVARNSQIDVYAAYLS